ncbi:universal stress protein [Bacillus rubiinfantis]|uniref:universal stress protein n=1 Tax=Bacillus rubiinfantis TaxID=1499680 RepID=UPI003CCC8C79
MKKVKGRMDESILVCVSYGPNGERLIERGCQLAHMLHCPLHILTIDPAPFDELDGEKSDYITSWKALAAQFGPETYILKDDEKRPVADVIAEVAREKHITQIILGQTAQSRWEQLTKGSIINALLRKIPFVDLHIISVSRSLKNDEGHFEKGVRAYLEQQEKYYRLTFHYSERVMYEGIFFKEQGTDFNNGVFKFMKGSEMLQVPVVEDIVKELRHVRMTEPLDDDIL